MRTFAVYFFLAENRKSYLMDFFSVRVFGRRSLLVSNTIESMYCDGLLKRDLAQSLDIVRFTTGINTATSARPLMGWPARLHED